MPESFLGLGFEFDDVLNFSSRADPTLIGLLQALSTGAADPLVIRIGGNSTDDSLWTSAGAPARAGITYGLEQAWLQSVATMVRRSEARVVLGVNLRVNDPDLAAEWARAATAALGSSVIFEIGNEPNYYGGTRHIRPPDYSLDTYIDEYRAYARAIRHALAGQARFAGPAILTPGWMSRLPDFLSAESGQLDLVTYHQYPLSVCGKSPGDAGYPTIGQLLNDRATHGLAMELEPFAKQAHGAGLPFRVDELNSVVCLGANGVSNTFASALWLVDLLFEYITAGVDGVNLQSITRAYYTPFRPSDSGWTINPEYQGLLIAAEAFAGGTRLVPVKVRSAANVKAWATIDAGGTVRVVVLDKDSRGGRVQVSIPSRRAAGSLARLEAPSVASKTASYPAGDRATVQMGDAGYSFQMGGASGAMLTVKS